MRHPAEAALAQAEALLQAQDSALRAGDADALAPLVAALRGPLSVLAQHGRTALPASLRPRLQALARSSAAAHVLAQRRAHAAQECLDTLAPASGRLQEAHLAGTYGRTGGFRPGLRSAGYDTA